MTISLLKRKNKRGKNSFEKGVAAEKKALMFLTSLGYHLIGQRFKTKYGEIDLIFLYQEKVIFVEVKCRPTFEAGLRCLPERQIQRWQQAAAFFLSENAHYAPWCSQFDLVLIDRFFDIVHMPHVLMLDSFS